ncbi:MAG: nucleoside deaminase [Bacteroidota bacterium]|nr:nucleoside deaminase [Bacteroidota bacterium]
MNLSILSDEHFMQEALKEAQQAFDKDEIPVGAVIVCDGSIIAKAHNSTELLNDVTAHAEIQAITAASEYLGAKYLHDCTIYVTLEPCVMCAGALFWSQIGKVVYAAKDPKQGYSRLSENILHKATKTSSGIKESEALDLIQRFFKQKREK